MTKILCSKASPSSNCIMNRMYLSKCEKLDWNGKRAERKKKKNMFIICSNSQFKKIQYRIWLDQWFKYRS